MNKVTIALAALLALGSTAMAETYGSANTRAHAAQVQSVSSGSQAYASAYDAVILAPARVNPAEY